jgi:RNAse (barnase) inhibitor barstar
MTKAIPQKPLQELLAQAKQAGIYHLPVGGQTALTKAAKALGFARFKVNFEESDNMGTILAALGRDLEFPNWYGANFDGLNDCLTDFSWREAPGYIITISHADAVHAVANSFSALNEVLTNAIETWQAQNVPLWIFYDLRADGIATLPALA